MMPERTTAAATRIACSRSRSFRAWCVRPEGWGGSVSEVSRRRRRETNGPDRGKPGAWTATFAFTEVAHRLTKASTDRDFGVTWTEMVPYPFNKQASYHVHGVVEATLEQGGTVEGR